MKLSHLFAIAALTLIASVTCHAGPVDFPSKSAAIFSLDIPDEWHPKIKDDELEATAPKDAAYVAIWMVKSETELKNLDKDVKDILKDSVVEPKMGEGSMKKVNGIDFMQFSGTGKDKKEKTPVTFEVWMFEAAPNKLVVIYLDYDTDATPELIKSLVTMITTIKKK